MNTFDLAAAIAEKDRIMSERERMARYRAAQEAARQERQAQQAQTAEATPQAITAPAVEEKPAQPVEQPQADEKILTVKFCIHVTKAQLDGLGEYMRANGIKPERI
jgi:hemolysin activation/secretion protein